MRVRKKRGASITFAADGIQYLRGIFQVTIPSKLIPLIQDLRSQIKSTTRCMKRVSLHIQPAESALQKVRHCFARPEVLGGWQRRAEVQVELTMGRTRGGGPQLK